MRTPQFLITYKKFISYTLAALTTVGSIAGGSLWLFQEVAWKKDIVVIEQRLSAKMDVSLLETLKIRLDTVRSDYDIYDGAIRTYEAKESLTTNELRNKKIFEDNRRDAKEEMKSIERRIKFLEKKIDGER